MLASYLLSLREGIEAALIIGITLSILKRTNRTDLFSTVFLGIGLAIAASLGAAFGLNWLGAEFEGAIEEIFEGFAMILAAGLITWMIIWLARQGQNFKKEVENNVNAAVQKNNKTAIFLLVFTSVLREGIELALFLFAIQFASEGLLVIIGVVLGLFTSVILGWLLFSSSLKLNMGQFFRVSNILLLLFAVGLLAHGVHEFNEVGWIPSIIEHVWDINHILSENNGFGLILKTLFGYNGNPSLSEVITYLLYASMAVYFFFITGNRQTLSKDLVSD
jgi:high-affinity iron transporter